jgi:hypothetical protein
MIKGCAGDNPLDTSPIQKFLFKIYQTNFEIVTNSVYITIGTEGRIYKFNDLSNINNISRINLNSSNTLLDYFNFKNNLSGAEFHYLVGEKGQFYKSNNGSINSNLTWQIRQIPTNGKLNSVFFVDENRGWVAGTNGRIFHTTNGGDSWVDTSLAFQHNITEIEYLHNGSGYLVGSEDLTNTNAILYITSDFGNEWTKVNLEDLILNTEVNNGILKGINQVKKIGEEYYLIADNGIIKTSKLFETSLNLNDFTIVFTIDDNLEIENQFTISSISKVNSQNYIVGYKGHNIGVIYNQSDNIYTETNSHILDCITDKNNPENLILIGGYGYTILNYKNGTVTKNELK